MPCAPTVNDVVGGNAAVPLLKVTEPRLLVPSLNCTVPVGVRGITADTTAVNVTGCPEVAGFIEDETLVELASRFTVCAKEELVLPVKLASPV